MKRLLASEALSRVLQVQRQMDDLEIVDTDETNHDALAAYYADGSNKDHDKPPVVNSHAQTHASRDILARARARTRARGPARTHH